MKLRSLPVEKRRLLARDASPEILIALSMDSDREVVRQVAYNRATPPKALQRIAESGTFTDYVLVENPSCPRAVLEMICLPNRYTEIDRIVGCTSHSYDLANAAKHPNASTQALRNLSKLRNFWIRLALARNNNTPPDAIARLARFPRLWNEDMRRAIALNPNTPATILRRLARSWDRSTISRLAANPATPIDILERLAEHGDGETRLNVIFNPSTPDARKKAAQKQHWPSI